MNYPFHSIHYPWQKNNPPGAACQKRISACGPGPAFEKKEGGAGCSKVEFEKIADEKRLFFGEKTIASSKINSPYSEKLSTNC